MKLQRTTWILVALALVLGGGVYFYEIQVKPKQEAIQAKQKQIFDFEEKEIKRLTIEKEEQVLEFERTDDENNPWQMKQPEDVSASDASVSFLLDLLVEGKSDRSFTIPRNQSKEYGFEQPLATVKVQLENQENHELILGKTDFNEQFLYAQADPPSETEQELEIMLVPKNFQYAVEREFEEWKQTEEDSEPTSEQEK